MLDESDPSRGAALKGYRVAAMKTQAEVASAARLGVVTVKRAEAGQPLRPETAAALCSVLGIPAGTFVGPEWGAHRPVQVPVAPVVSNVADASRAKRRRWARSGFVLLAALVEAASWMPFAQPLATFILLQRLAMVILGAVVVDVSFARAWSGRAEGARSRAIVLPAVAGFAILCWLPICVVMGEFATRRDGLSIWRDYARANRSIRLRHLMTPAWDKTEAQWVLLRWLDARLLVEDPRLETPGVYAARLANVSECHHQYMYAPTFDRARCQPSTTAVDGRGVGALWQALVGGSSMALPAWSDMTSEHPSVLDWPGFDDARKLSEEGRAYDEAGYLADDRAAAWAVAHRDRAGPDG